MVKSTISRVLLITLLMALPCFAGEVAVLKNGFSIVHERREVIGDLTRLFISADGSNFVDVPTDDIEHFEAAPDEPSVPRFQPPLPGYPLLPSPLATMLAEHFLPVLQLI
jgi:hypothetical protein